MAEARIKSMTSKEFNDLLKDRLDFNFDLAKYTETSDYDVVAVYSGEKREEFNEDFLDWYGENPDENNWEDLELDWLVESLVMLGDLPEKTILRIRILPKEEELEDVSIN